MFNPEQKNQLVFISNIKKPKKPNLLWANAFREKWQKGVLNFESFYKIYF